MTSQSHHALAPQRINTVISLLRAILARMPERTTGRETNGKFGIGNRAARKPRTVAETFSQVFAETMRKAAKDAKIASSPRRTRDPDDD